MTVAQAVLAERTDAAHLFPSARAFGVGLEPSAVAVGDVNQDGIADLVAANRGSNTVSVLLGVGDGTFNAKVDSYAGATPSSVAIGDLDGDGTPDLAVANQDANTVTVLRGDGNGTFYEYWVSDVGLSPRSVAIGDLNGDEVLDLAVANQGSNTVSVLLVEYDGSSWAVADKVDYATGAEPGAVAIGDLNRDGAPDLAVTNEGSSSVSVLLGLGSGSFGAGTDFATEAGPLAVAIGDLNGDAVPDLVTGNRASSTVSVFLGRGDGGFGARSDHPYPGGMASMGAGSVVIGDLNGDGNPDLSVPNYIYLVMPIAYLGVVDVWLGNGDGTFGAAPSKEAIIEEGVPLSLAVADLNGDGRLDVATANGTNGPYSGWVAVLLGNGDGGFGPRTFGTEGSPAAVAIVDLDGDLESDLVTANAGSNTVSVLLGNGDGTFGSRSDFATGVRPKAVAAGDLNGDGRPDLVTANAGSNTVSVLLGNGDGTFGSRSDFATGIGPTAVAIGDLNGDGKLEVVAANVDANTISVLFGNGDGTFGPKCDLAAGTAPISVAIGDLSSDGKPDLVAANHGSNSVSVLLGNGDGTFGPGSSFATGSYPLSVAVGDLNGDGRADLAAAVDAGVSVLLGNDDGTFRTKTDFWTWEVAGSVAIDDMDGDGKADLASTNGPIVIGGWSFVVVLLGHGDGTFSADSRYWTGASPHQVVAGDLNGDGRRDLVTANGASVSVLMNTGGRSLLGVKPSTPGLPRDFWLDSPRPNPSRGTTEIRFLLPAECLVEVTLFDLAGRVVRSLAAGERIGAGAHAVRWDGLDDSGGRLAAGVYTVRVRAGRSVSAKRIVLVR